MKDDQDNQADLNKQFAAQGARLARGVCQSINWTAGTASVNVGGTVVDLQMAGIPPIIGDTCVIAYFGAQPVVVGPKPRSPFATTTAAVSGGLVAITGDDGVTDSVAANGFTPTTGTRIAIDWAGGGVMVGALSADPNTGKLQNVSITPPVVAPVHKTRTQTFYPQWSGTQNTGSSNFWDSRVWCGDTTLGAYGYGAQIANTIPNTATINGGSIYMGIAGDDFGDPPTIGTHTLGSRAGIISVSNTVTIFAGSGQKGLNSTILSALQTGAALGIATNHGGLHIFGASPGSGALTITWTT